MIAVYTAADIEKAGLPGMLPVGWLLPDLKTPPHPILANDKVRYVGDAVAVVVAEDRYPARDAADLVEVDYEPLPAVTIAAKAVEKGAPQIHAEAAGNVAFDWEIGDASDRGGVRRAPLTRRRSSCATTGSSPMRSSRARRSPTTTRRRAS